MTILEFFRTTRANLWLLIIGIIVGAAAGFGYASLQPKVYAASSSGYVTVGESGTVDVLSGSTAAKERARSYAAIVSSEAVAQKIKQNTPELSLTTGQIRSSLTATAGDNAALITVSAQASSPKNAQLLANSALQATADYIKEIEQNPGNAQALVNGDSNAAATPPANSNTVRVIPLNNASVNPPLVSPNYQQNTLIGAVIGLVVVYTAIFLRRALDQRIRTRDDATKATGASILGVLPVSEDLNEENIVNGDTDDHIAQESIRQLRTNLRFVNVDTPPRSFIVTSAVPGEGKSTVSLSLARSLADAGSPVILIDADLRRPTVAKKLKLDAKVGLTQVLAGQVEIANAVHQLGDSNLFVLPAGRIPPNPSELLGSDKMRQLIKELSEEFIVVVDVPPLLPVTDASLLSHSVDGVILVGSIGRSHREQMAEASSILKKVNANLFGLVLNRAPRKGLGNSYYGFGYASTYVGYATYYGYGKDGDKKSSKSKSSAPKA
ncbi:polysaccharide biosynthesis tyrosine autokinase [Rothia sp. HMSC068F09]|uniref:non-specific protein-tyrosine kinase n=1 Tax=Rothia mucilaginosa TaxID=43675 RepID=A0A930LV94_9MICC|nr:polysaccharide biosynthesis tyrosine autokinase [Rothia sp. HMSC068F09]MBF1673992.1 polysaccharide biosynthesis tyrosine autokinase [Rothia mucilaginosa]OFR66251.1 lipopolysaccharide biosynthesis protein [Rothia sp. HMSC068F09]